MLRMRGRLLDPAADLGPAVAAVLEPEGHVLEHRHVRVERVVLEHHGDVAVLGRRLVDQGIADPDLAGGDLLEAGDHAQGRALAAARRADQDHELAIGDREVDAAHRLDAAIALAEALEGDRGHGAPLGRRPGAARAAPASAPSREDRPPPARGQPRKPPVVTPEVFCQKRKDEAHVLRAGDARRRPRRGPAGRDGRPGAARRGLRRRRHGRDRLRPRPRRHGALSARRRADGGARRPGRADGGACVLQHRQRRHGELAPDRRAREAGPPAAARRGRPPASSAAPAASPARPIGPATGRPGTPT